MQGPSGEQSQQMTGPRPSAPIGGPTPQQSSPRGPTPRPAQPKQQPQQSATSGAASFFSNFF
ncbi:hypothetical protein QR98_0016010 [Sarcoptes scabiei]|uniref:Uncharacterized protein n=1 Tax=Sarcoptes scabiei TaxID=52283 RepID=A0A131ZWX9_SARSC|nr:hypothetical protein QR98_0016010 [Sarcoptes scabiei]